MHRPPTAITARTWMNTRVRVLNVTYEDFDVVPAARAVVLLNEELAITLVEHTPRFVVRSQHVAIPLPHTIQLLEYVHTPPRPAIDDDTRASFAAVLARDHHRCAYCGQPGARTVDHVFPKSRGGGDHYGNLVARLLGLQRPQGRPHPRGGRHAAPVGAPGTPYRPEAPAGHLARVDPNNLNRLEGGTSR